MGTGQIPTCLLVTWMATDHGATLFGSVYDGIKTIILKQHVNSACFKIYIIIPNEHYQTCITLSDQTLIIWIKIFREKSSDYLKSENAAANCKRLDRDKTYAQSKFYRKEEKT